MYHYQDDDRRINTLMKRGEGDAREQSWFIEAVSYERNVSLHAGLTRDE